MNNAIKNLFEDKNGLVESCYDSLNRNVDIYTIDYSKGETNITTLLQIPKRNLHFKNAIVILLLHHKMYSEEWDITQTYTKDDIAFWISLIEKENEEATYVENISAAEFEKDFFVERLQMEEGLTNIVQNNMPINFVAFQNANPLNQKLFSISKLNFKRLEATYFLESEKHYILFHWYTTA